MASQAGVSGPAVAAIAGGVLLVASGVTNQKLTTLLADLVAGRPPTPGPRQSFQFGVGTPDASSPGLSAVGGGDFPTPAGGNRGLGQTMAAAAGWTGEQWAALDWLGNAESGWRTDATNPHSGAYGIPQALPPGKMAAAGADWRTNPATQIRWMISYIKGRYGTPAAAAAFHRAHGWY